MSEHIPLEDLSARIDDALEPARRDQVDAHLATCEACRSEYESLRWSVSFVRAVPRKPLPPGASLLIPVDDEPERTGRRWLPRTGLGWAGAGAGALAAVAVAIAIGVLAIGPRLAPTDQMALAPVGVEEAMVEGADAPFNDDEPVSALAVEESPEMEAVSEMLEESRGLADSDDEASFDAAPALGRRGPLPTRPVGTADASIGYPEPLGTSRSRGFVAPPPEVRVEQPSPDLTALAADLAAGRPADVVESAMGGEAVEEPLVPTPAPPATTESTAAAAPTLVAAADPETAPETDDEAAADGGAPATDALEAGAAASAAPQASAPWIAVGALAVVLLALSALLYVRARR